MSSALDKFWDDEKKRRETPNILDLTHILQKLLLEKDHHRCFIVLDALDECEDAEREEVMSMIRDVLMVDNRGICVLLTSRTNTVGVGRGLKGLTNFYNIAIERRHVDLDTLAHITERLQNDRNLGALPAKEREKIKSCLVENDAGMFRWVDCQLQAIRRCRNSAELDRTLSTLPRDLHEQYAKDMASIADSASHDARKLLEWLAFSQRKYVNLCVHFRC